MPGVEWAAIGLPGLFALLAALCLIATAVADVRHFEIPDGLSVALIAGAIAYGLVAPQFNWWSHIAAPIGFFAFGLLAFSRGWLGGGDVKVMTGVAAWTGLHGLLPMFLAVSIAGGVLAALLLLQRRFLPIARPRVFSPDAPIPYAVAIAAGTLWWAWLSWPLR